MTSIVTRPKLQVFIQPGTISDGNYSEWGGGGGEMLHGDVRKISNP